MDEENQLLEKCASENYLTVISDALYQGVDQDESRLWYLVNVLAEAAQYQEAVKLLTKMETQYHLNVRQHAVRFLPTAFLSSKEYKLWYSQPSFRKNAAGPATAV